MLTPTHHLAGLAAGLTVAAHVRPGVVPVLLLLAASTATAGGVLSPDVDQRRGYHFVDRLLPDELLGHGGPMRHRGLSHFWGLPVAAAVFLWVSRATLPVPLWWLAAGVVVGWASHLASDFLVGARSEFRGPGIPVAPWFWHVGLGFRCGGVVEIACGRLVLPALIIWQSALLAGWVD